MAKRKRVGLVFSYNENWIGGTYYFLNLVQALKSVSENSKPIISVIGSTNEGFEYLKKETEYPYLEYYYQQRTLSIVERGVNKVFRLVGLPKAFKTKANPKSLDMVYQYYADPSPDIKPKVFWIPDFQEKFLPQYFSSEEIDQRHEFYEKIATNEKHIAFSSNNALSHFESFFPETQIQKNVIQFAVTHPKYDTIDAKSILEKYNLPGRYYFTPNQFWEHKNHILVLKAVNELKKKGVEIVVAFSGKEDDYRNADYVTKLKDHISDNNLTQNIRFLGFLPRTDQLFLMKNAIAIVQPSFFEGWSTVVEDAKALNSYIFLSNLDVHKEQMNVNCDFFDPKNETELAILLERFSKEKPKMITTDYQENIVSFGNSFVNLIDKVTQS